MQTLAWLYDVAPWAAVGCVMGAAMVLCLVLLIGDGRRSMELSEYDKEDPPMK